MAAKQAMVFVYGTLRTNQPNSHFLASGERVAEQCWTKGKLYDTGRGYPTVFAGKNRVFGELYKVNEKQLQALDRLEGYYGKDGDNEFVRIRRRVYTDRGVSRAYLYAYPGEPDPSHTYIPSGDWKCHQLLQRLPLYYFAFGSCMDHARFQEEGVDHKFQDTLGKGILKGYTLRFTLRYPDGGRADIVETGGEVEGIVYRIDEEAKEYLFQREGVYTRTYRPAFVDIHMGDGILRDVLTFIVVDKKKETAPPDWYAAEILRGGKGVVSDQYLSKIRRHLKNKFHMKLDV